MKILYVSTLISTIDSFLVSHIETIRENGHLVDIAGQFNLDISNKLKSISRKIFNVPLQRFPFSPKNIYAFKLLYRIIKQEKYDIVHLHTPVASVIGRLACFISKTKCFYTAHGFHFYKGASLINWLFFFPIEFIMSFITDTIITINKEDYEFAKKYFHSNHIDYIPGVGIDLEKFTNTKIDKTTKKKELNIPDNCKLILSVGELNSNKNHQVVLKALAKINNKNIHYAICGAGILEKELKKLAKELDINDNFHLLGQRKDIPEILKCADIFVFPTLREGLGLAAIEALASGLPLIIADNRGSREFAIDKINSYVIEPNDVESIKNRIVDLLNNNEIRKKFILNSRKTIDRFSVKNVSKKIKEIYKLNKCNPKED